MRPPTYDDPDAPPKEHPPRDAHPPTDAGGPEDESPHWSESLSTQPFSVDSPRRLGVRSMFAVPQGLQGATTSPAVAAVVGAALIAVVLGVVLLARWWWAEANAEEQRIPATVASAPAATGSAAAGGGPAGAPSIGTADSGTHPGGIIAPASEAPTAAPGASDGGGVPGVTSVAVHVAGKVRKPGVVTLDAGARVIDAVQRAGGLAPGADATTVNLARPVVDGEQIVVLAVGEAPKPGAPQSSGSAAAAGGAATAARKVDLNRADQTELETLPGVGPVLAGRIIEWRTAHGRFSSVDELSEVSGVGEKTFARLQPLVTV